MPGGRMFSVPIEPTGPERARWLAELATALEEASILLGGASLDPPDLAEARDLFVSIEAARMETQALLRSRALIPRQEISPEWTYPAVWVRAGSDL
jgi:hypothetical protein